MLISDLEEISSEQYFSDMFSPSHPGKWQCRQDIKDWPKSVEPVEGLFTPRNIYFLKYKKLNYISCLCPFKERNVNKQVMEYRHST